MGKIIFCLLFLSVAIYSKDVVYQGGDALRVIPFDNSVYVTGLKNKGLYKIENNKKVEILNENLTIINFEIGKGLKIETNDGNFIIDENSVSEDESVKSVKIDKNDVYLKNKTSWEKISDSKDTYYLPRINNNFVLYSGLNKGLFVYNSINKTTYYIDNGNHANFTSNGKQIVYAKITDDGEKFTSGQIYIYDIETKKIKALLIDNDIKMYPIISGNKLYYQANYNIYVIDIK